MTWSKYEMFSLNHENGKWEKNVVKARNEWEAIEKAKKIWNPRKLRKVV